MMPGTYYVLRSPMIEFPAKDTAILGADGAEVAEHNYVIYLRRDEVVLCTRVHRRAGGARGSGRYARLLCKRNGDTLVLWHRVSGYDRGSGEWRELQPVEALALAEHLPLS